MLMGVRSLVDQIIGDSLFLCPCVLIGRRFEGGRNIGLIRLSAIKSSIGLIGKRSIRYLLTNCLFALQEDQIVYVSRSAMGASAPAFFDKFLGIWMTTGPSLLVCIARGSQGLRH